MYYSYDVGDEEDLIILKLIIYSIYIFLTTSLVFFFVIMGLIVYFCITIVIPYLKLKIELSEPLKI